MGPLGGQGKDRVLLTHLDRQFVGCGVQYNRGNIFDREFALQKTKLRDVMLLRYDIAGANQQCNDDSNTKQTDADEKGGS